VSVYTGGETVRVGDRVRYAGEGGEQTGVVVCDIAAGAYTAAFTEADWGYLKEGFIVEFARLGVVHFSDLTDEDLTLVAREELT